MRALLLTLLLAGCLAPSLATPAIQAAEGAAELSFSDCENLSGNFAVPASEARAELPSGFQPRSADASGESIFWMVSVRCGGSAVAGVEAGPAWFTYGELDVTAPPQWAIPGVSDHTIPLFALAQPQPIVDALVALGLPRVALASSSVETLATGATHVVVQSDEGSLEMVGQPTTGTGTLGAGEWGMFGVEGRRVVSRIHGSSTEGTVTSGALVQTNDGALPLVAHARPATRGGAVAGFGLAFERVA